MTAAFNLNLLERINRELEGDFDLAHFEHHAIWEPTLARIEIYIRSTRAQVVHVAGHSFSFAAGELLLTEYSHKYTRESIQALALEAGFERSTIWTDPNELFGVGLFKLAD